MDTVTAQLCQKEIHHCHKWINTFMQSDAGGSLQQYTDLAVLMNSPAAGVEANDVASITDDEEEEKEEKEEGEDEAHTSWTQ